MQVLTEQRWSNCTRNAVDESDNAVCICHLVGAKHLNKYDRTEAHISTCGKEKQKEVSDLHKEYRKEKQTSMTESLDVQLRIAHSPYLSLNEILVKRKESKILTITIKKSAT